ncbi:T9SS type A sorting domain-containing protein [Rudanella paleaurantiibacter]|uniref:T9SS type A sorting domain-containing protein n=1 Tax=Rudanella paleaurantiibacter TaxID=2614655 RepID=A0A7J5U374_9BACT|nr:metallophosphoesterase [Rudanella paleaurantiibacter]KAB7731444.1 T9SS type A sorting domain-containing protein [Rudanella paleaurantiibacter]
MHYLLTALLLFLFTGSLAQTPTLTRGPYLQVVTSTGITIRWRTNVPTETRVWYGTTPNSLTQSVEDKTPVTEHVLSLTGLSPATRYYYAIGQADTRLAGDAGHTFKTALPPGDTRPFRIWSLGDFGDGTPNQMAVYEQYRKATANQPAELWIWLGDNAYCCGTEEEFQRYVFDVYPEHLRSLPSYATPGNHDYADQNQKFDSPYFNIFSFPQTGQAGGVPSGSKMYYSFDYGNVHFVSLDSFGMEGGQWALYDPSSPQVRWLERDLAANKQPWTVVFFHHPPYTRSARDSDVEIVLQHLRENLTPILERYNVDIVMSGHSHTYERSYRIRNFQGKANTFNPAVHLAETTTGRYDGSANSCPILTKGQGTVYVVNGSGGALGGRFAGNPDHPAMAATHRNPGGSMILDVNDNRLDAQFVAADGVVRDRFTIMKNVGKTESLRLNYGDTLQLRASWPAPRYNWTEAGQTERTARYVARQAGTFTVAVTDEQRCLRDEFNLTVQAPTATETFAEGQLRVFPNPTTESVQLELSLNKPQESTIDVVDAAGRSVQHIVLRSALTHQRRITLPQPGVYTIRVQVGGTVLNRRVVRQ